jgi:hypothetical protein
MAHEEEERLLGLLVRVVACRRGTQKVEYSREDGRTLWDGGDRVEHAEGAKQYGFYVTLHHFNGEIIGKHVALAPADVVKFCGGEKHVYRLRRGSGENEHLSVYVYNPAVNGNGPLRFEVSTTDAVQRMEARCVQVAEDTCPTVLRFGCASMQKGHETVLRRLEHEYQIVLQIGFYGESQRVPRTRCLQCCELRLDLMQGASGAPGGRAKRRWYCTHCFELRHWV